MNERIKKESARFNAKTADGRICRLVETSIFINVGTVSDTGMVWQFDKKSYATESGFPINQLSDNEFEIVSTGDKVTRIP